MVQYDNSAEFRKRTAVETPADLPVLMSNGKLPVT